MTDLPPEDLLRIADRHLDTLRIALNDFASAVGEINAPQVLASYLADLRDHRQDVGRVYDEVERALIFCAGDKKLEVEGVGLVEIKSSVRRTGWQHDDLFRSVVARIIDTPGVFYDEDGTSLYPAQAAANVVERLREVLSPSWKVTGLRALGLDADEFCETDEKHYSVKLPGRDEAA